MVSFVLLKGKYNWLSVFDCLGCFIFSVNTTLDGNSFKVSRDEAKEVVNKTPEFSAPQPVEPIGMYLIKYYLSYLKMFM